jgi:hypothetical protein
VVLIKIPAEGGSPFVLARIDDLPMGTIRTPEGRIVGSHSNPGPCSATADGGGAEAD